MAERLEESLIIKTMKMTLHEYKLRTSRSASCAFSERLDTLRAAVSWFLRSGMASPPWTLDWASLMAPPLLLGGTYFPAVGADWSPSL
jgi:hypothetical protein